MYSGEADTITISDVPEPARVSLLRNGVILNYAYKAGVLTFEVPQAERISGDEVVTVTWHRTAEGYRNDIFQFAE